MAKTQEKKTAEKPGKLRQRPKPRSYESRSHYPCTDCGATAMPQVESARPETQTAFECHKCGLYHEVHNSRFRS